MKKKQMDVSNGLSKINFTYVGINRKEINTPGYIKFKIGYTNPSNAGDREQKLICGGADWDLLYIFPEGDYYNLTAVQVEATCKKKFADFLFKRTRVLFGSENTECFDLPIELFNETIKEFPFIPATDENIENHPRLATVKAAREFFTKHPYQYPGPALKGKQKIEREIENREATKDFFGYELVTTTPQRLGGIGREEDVLKDELQNKNPHFKLFKEKEEKDLSGKE